MGGKKILKVIMSAALVSTIALTGLLTGCVAKQEVSPAAYSDNEFRGKNPKYVFLFIGDGMSATQTNTAEIYLGAQKQGTNPQVDRLSFTQFPTQGLKTTYAADSFIPDSASAGTAMATGNKTTDGVINMDPGKTVKYKSIAEMAKENGMKVGIVSSVSIDHATPAVFYAHQPSRSNYYDIAIELGKSNFDYFGGGGLLQPKGKNNDKSDAYDEAAKNGYKVVKSVSEFNSLNKDSGKVFAVSPVLDSSAALPYAINNTKDGLTLKDFTRKGIELLDNKDGFFMMVEGGKIDWACHANDAATSIHDVLAFDDSVKEAIKFYEKYPNDTLIMVTGDHETGGLTIGFAGTKYETFFDKLKNQNISYDEFEKSVVKEYAKDHTPENTNINDLLPAIKEKFGLMTATDAEKKALEEKAKAGDKEAGKKLGLIFTEYELNNLKEALKVSMMKTKPTDEKTYLLYGGYDPLTITLTHLINQKSGIGWTTYSHTGVPIPVYVMGSGEELFAGYYDDTDTFTKLVTVMGLRYNK
jgi:alkaline phosphatase